MIQTAVLGYGNIGNGVVTVLESNKDVIAKKVGEQVHVKHILEIRDVKPEDPFADRVVKELDIIVNDPEVSIVVETMGGTKPAYEYVKKCLLAGKSVATSNKELVAKHGAELLAIASEKKVSFLFEASVGGGIPIIRPINNCITADRIQSVTGILNGTTNYMLTRMEREGADYDAVLKAAQELGYAERNPSADVDGFDACRKIAILTSLVFGKEVNSEEIYTEGITAISDVDMKYAKALGCTIKLLAMSYLKDGRVYAMVSPRLLSGVHPLSGVNEVMNGVYVHGEMTGDLMFYGAGAGKLPTASAVAADVVEAAMNPGRTMMKGWTSEKMELGDVLDTEQAFFFRVSAEDADTVKGLFGDKAMALDTVVSGETGFVTEVMKEREFNELTASIKDKVRSRIRMA
ncbi:MAG: homoserine dehydrogenase [Lachnospiraceae bacterium]|nr:homoserine dehydrogenase [Lachnospiraceae bacterium]